MAVSTDKMGEFKPDSDRLVLSKELPRVIFELKFKLDVDVLVLPVHNRTRRPVVASGLNSNIVFPNSDTSLDSSSTVRPNSSKAEEAGVVPTEELLSLPPLLLLLSLSFS
jgi:hypothetical protein